MHEGRRGLGGLRLRGVGARSRLSGAALALLGLASLGACSSAQDPEREPLRSTFNGLELDAQEPWTEYSFTVLGHPRGAKDRPSPNAVLREHVGRLTANGARFVVALGDLYFAATEPRIQEFRDWVETSIDVPFFNAVGGHDIGIFEGDPGPGRPNYEQAFGPFWFDFVLGSELFVFLDLQSWEHTIGGEQRAYFDRVVKRAVHDDSIQNVFVFTHKVFWSYNNPAMPDVFRYRHPVKVAEDYDHFEKQIRPPLEWVAEQGKHVYLMAGDIGGTTAHLQMYYHRDQHLTYVATGMGVPWRDGFVEVSVKNGEVTMKAVSFKTGEAGPIEIFDNTFWREFYQGNPELAARAVPEYFWKKPDEKKN